MFERNPNKGVNSRLRCSFQTIVLFFPGAPWTPSLARRGLASWLLLAGLADPGPALLARGFSVTGYRHGLPSSGERAGVGSFEGGRAATFG